MVGAEREGVLRGCQRVHVKPVLSAGCLSSAAVGLLAEAVPRLMNARHTHGGPSHLGRLSNGCKRHLAKGSLAISSNPLKSVIRREAYDRANVCVLSSPCIISPKQCRPKF